jgi:hypothetical protein
MMSVFPSEFVRNTLLLSVARSVEFLARVPGVQMVVAGDYILIASPDPVLH